MNSPPPSTRDDEEMMALHTNKSRCARDRTNCASDFIAMLRRHAADASQDIALRYLDDGDRETHALGFRELDQRARALAAILQDRRLSGERVLILHPPGPEYVCAFLACLYAGAVAVPVALSKQDRLLRRIETIAAHSRPAAALTSAHVEDVSWLGASLGPSVSVLRIDSGDLDSVCADTWQPPVLCDEDLAFLQYTSGSTGTPHGVRITHGNLVHQEELLRRHFRLSKESRLVTWLPAYHDMGLIGGLLAPLYVGFECIWMPSAAFLGQPSRWLKAISRYQATVSGGPNFGYDLCVDKIDADTCADVDLSSWQLAFTGAEPIHARTLERFSRRFEANGFRIEAFWSCYGLAEATLMASGGRGACGPNILHVDKERLAANEVVLSNESSGTPLVSCGAPAQPLLIVDPHSGRRLEVGHIGEIWISGGSVASGLWNDRQESAARFEAHLAESGEGPFLRTGDLGFLDRGELYVTGRLSDRIIVRGKNYYPQDIERTAESAHCAVRPNAVAAFGVETQGSEAVVVVAEIHPRMTESPQDVIESVRISVARAHGIDLHAVVLIRGGHLLRTTSGKVQRRAMKDLFIGGSLKAVATWSAIAYGGCGGERDNSQISILELECVVQAAWKDVLGVSSAQAGDDFFLQGGNSLKATQLAARLTRELSRALTVDAVFDHPKVANLVKWLASAPTAVVDDGPTDTACTQDAPLSDSQQRIWFIEQLSPGNPFYHIAVRLDVDEPFEEHALRGALVAVVQRHEALRATFTMQEGVPRQRFQHTADVPMEVLDLGGNEDEAVLNERLRVEAIRPFNIESGPLVRAVLVNRARRRATVLLVAHHLTCDGWGMRVVLRELADCYHALTHGRAIAAPAVALSFGRHCRERAAADLDNPVRQQRCEFWQAVLTKLPRTDLPLDLIAAKEEKVLRGSRVSCCLDAESSAEIAELSRTHHASMFMALACALQLLISRWTEQHDVLIGAAAANRADIRQQELVGCVMNFIVLRVAFSDQISLSDALARSVRACRDALAHQDYPFQDLIRDLAPEHRLGRMPLYRVGLWMHNYFEPLQLAGSTASWPVLIDTQTAELDLRMLATPQPDGGIQLDLEYREDCFRRETAEALLESYRAVLNQLVHVPASRVIDVKLSPALLSSRRSAAKARYVRVMANFTAAPIGESVLHWLGKLAHSVHLDFAGSETVVAELLDPHAPCGDVNAVFIDLEDWLGDGSAAQKETNLEFSIRSLSRALLEISTRGTTSFVYICPRNVTFEDTTELKQAMDRALSVVKTAGSLIDNVHVFDLEEFLPRYRVLDCRNSFTHLVGRIPFSEQFFAAVGTVFARHLHALWARPRKVIAVDADDTLWGGNCAELGAEGVQIERGHQLLHERLDALHRQGFLLCVLSKNIETDVVDVLRCGRLSLSEQHFVARRINWQSKTDNLRSLAAQLSLSLDSFILLDDSPVECAQMRLDCPEVLTVQIVHEQQSAIAILDHLWSLDRFLITAEDRVRSEMYRAEGHRMDLREASDSFSEFIAGLDLQVDMLPARPDDLARVAQLLQRTNQFNLTGITYDSIQLNERLTHPSHQLWVVRVSDRYGDYGLAGALLLEIQGKVLRLENAVLSCRVLGRQVELTMLEQLCELALLREAVELEIAFAATSRNHPARQWLEDTVPGATIRGSEMVRVRERVASIQSRLNAYRNSPWSAPKESHEDTRDRMVEETEIERIRLLESIAQHRAGADDILEQLRRAPNERPTEAGEYVEPHPGLETLVAGLMADVLHIEKVGRHDVFFSLGGYSLLAVRLLARIRDLCAVRVSLEQFFTNPTAAGLAAVIATEMVGAAGERSVAELLDSLESVPGD